jgi:CheY-like chemotaxis protein
MASRKKRILVIEDDAEMRRLLRDFIQEAGYEAHSVENGSAAFIRTARESFDLIVTDIRMPGLSGLEILPGLKRLQPNVPIIVITAFGGDEVHQRAMERGAQAYMEKPIYLEDLKRLMKEMVC